MSILIRDVFLVPRRRRDGTKYRCWVKRRRRLYEQYIHPLYGSEIELFFIQFFYFQWESESVTPALALTREKNTPAARNCREELWTGRDEETCRRNQSRLWRSGSMIIDTTPTQLIKRRATSLTAPTLQFFRYEPFSEPSEPYSCNNTLV